MAELHASVAEMDETVTCQSATMGASRSHDSHGLMEDVDRTARRMTKESPPAGAPKRTRSPC